MYCRRAAGQGKERRPRCNQCASWDLMAFTLALPIHCPPAIVVHLQKISPNHQDLAEQLEEFVEVLEFLIERVSCREVQELFKDEEGARVSLGERASRLWGVGLSIVVPCCVHTHRSHTSPRSHDTLLQPPSLPPSAGSAHGSLNTTRISGASGRRSRVAMASKDRERGYLEGEYVGQTYAFSLSLRESYGLSLES